ncbi:MAG: rane protein, partial [Thermoleophilia bacterium]|jgi:membrane-associated phospholipid phosphatase|nr:rane protein [Thermoleophilia bacterium]
VRRRELLLAGVLLLALALILATAVALLGMPALDDTLVRHLHAWLDGPLGATFVWATDVGFAGTLGPVTVVLALLVGPLLRRWYEAAVLASSMLVVAVLNALLKRVFDRERPNLDVEHALESFSMPSGHASASAALAAGLILCARTRRERWLVGVPAVAFALLVGTSRSVLGAHWPTDVLAGWAEGAGVALVVGGLLLTRAITADTPPR